MKYTSLEYETSLEADKEKEKVGSIVISAKI